MTHIKEIPGTKIRPLMNGFLSAFSLNEFDQLLMFHLEVNREEISIGGTYIDVVFRVITWANRVGRVHELVEAARRERPNNSIFVEYATYLEIGIGGITETGELERIIRRSNGFLDVSQFRSRLGEIEGQVCRIDLNGNGIATGFLVGPKAVLTNYHVVKDAILSERSLQEYSCRFDYKELPNKKVLNTGVTYPIIEVASYSSYHEADYSKSPGLPDENHLDYALLVLDGQPGSEAISGTLLGEQRGWVTCTSTPYPFHPKSPLFIVQHPDGLPMKISFETEAILGLNENGTRVRYSTNTLHGSSGSPCFNQNWDLVALHHSSDTSQTPNWNQGIPIHLITKHIIKHNLDALLCKS